ncbi:MAG: lamin tail domain-containing protein, partial [Verrucomicrobia bacterium]|nr:lamin tail domain-containing protein [Verrucomicrobiota bacterium]
MALETAADDGGMGSVALMEMLSGETCTAIVFRSLQRQGSGSSLEVELCVPDGIANVDMFASTALLPNGPFWSLAGTNLPVVSNRVVWEWAPWVDSQLVLAAGDATWDTDGDGLQDAREFFLYGSDSMLADTDGDRLPDGWEVENGLNPLDAADAGEDPDRDGWRNLEEYEGGTDIHDRLSNLGFGPQLMINEFVYHPASGQNQWVELFNRNLLPIDLSGFRIQVSDGGSFSTEYVIPSNTVIGAADFLVIAESGGPVTGDVSGALYLEIPYDGTASRTAALRLVGPGTDPVTNDRWVVDACLYDRPNTHSYAQVGFDRYNDEYYAPYAKPGQSLIRSPQGQDLSIGGSEWTWSTNPSPTYAGTLDPDEDGLGTALELSGTMNPYDNRPTDPFAMDSDGDGLSDSAEMAQASDPL